MVYSAYIDIRQNVFQHHFLEFASTVICASFVLRLQFLWSSMTIYMTYSFPHFMLSGKHS